MRKNIKISIGIILIACISLATYGGLLYNSVNNAEYEVKNIYLTNINLSGTILSPRLDINLTIDLEAQTSSSISVNIDKLEYTMKIEGINFGSGSSNSFIISNTPSDIILQHEIKRLSFSAIYLLYDLYYEGNEKTVTIKITSVEIFGITINIDEEFEEIITKQDIDKLEGTLWEMLN